MLRARMFLGLLTILTVLGASAEVFAQTPTPSPKDKRQESGAQPAAPSEAQDASTPDAEATIWSRMQQSEDVKDIEVFLSAYPDSRFKDEAKKKLEQLKQRQGQLKKRIAEQQTRDPKPWTRINNNMERLPPMTMEGVVPVSMAVSDERVLKASPSTTGYHPSG